MGIGAAVAAASAAARGVSLKTYDQRLTWGRSLFGCCAMFCTFYTLGAPTIALGDAATLAATSPIFIAVLSPILLREYSGRGVWGATLLSFVGVVLIAGPSFQLKGSVALVATSGAFFTAMAMMWLRRLGSGAKESPEAIVVHFSTVAALATALLSIPGFRAPDLVGALLLLGTGLCGGLAQLSMTRAYALDKAARVGALGYLATALTHVLGIVVLGERPGAAEMVGAVLIVGAGVILSVGAMREVRARALPSPVRS